MPSLMARMRHQESERVDDGTRLHNDIQAPGHALLDCRSSTYPREPFLFPSPLFSGGEGVRFFGSGTIALRFTSAFTFWPWGLRLLETPLALQSVFQMAFCRSAKFLS